MIRLHVVVEGQTEEVFVRDMLGPELWQSDVITDVHRITTRRRRVKPYRGGFVDYNHLKNDLVLWMKQDRNIDSHFTTMVDLYALPENFPGATDCRRKPDPIDRVTCLESKLRADIQHPRFIPYLQLHEFEALLFSDVSGFETAFPARTDIFERLKSIKDEFPSPEHINEGPDASPSKRISHLLPQYTKPVAGPLVARQIGIVRMREQCKHFDSWIKILTALK